MKCEESTGVLVSTSDATYSKEFQQWSTLMEPQIKPISSQGNYFY